MGNGYDTVYLAKKVGPKGKVYAFGKIGVYNGKNNQGETRQSMFFDFVCFGKDAEDLQVTGKKGQPIIVNGRLEEDKSISQDGREFINKRVVCNSAKVCVKAQRENANTSYETQDPFAQYEA